MIKNNVSCADRQKISIFVETVYIWRRKLMLKKGDVTIQRPLIKKHNTGKHHISKYYKSGGKMFAL